MFFTVQKQMHKFQVFFQILNQIKGLQLLYDTVDVAP